MTHEEGERRLQQIWDEIRLEEEVGGVSSEHSCDDGDFIQDDHFSDTEQYNVSDSDSDVSVEESEVPLAHRLQFYRAESGKRWLKIPYTTSVKRKPCDVIRFTGDANIYISKVRGNYTRDRDAKSTAVREIGALIGLLYLAGVLK
ncbi:hypothetical protein JTB14_015822 [Gonioctena quinquepunctata]|nr:hypothetical protein JTB14_015822 [Gonioctena quinquepunctata]